MPSRCTRRGLASITSSRSKSSRLSGKRGRKPPPPPSVERLLRHAETGRPGVRGRFGGWTVRRTQPKNQQNSWRFSSKTDLDPSSWLPDGLDRVEAVGFGEPLCHDQIALASPAVTALDRPRLRCRPRVDHGKAAARKATGIARGDAGASRQRGCGDQRIEFLDRLSGLATGQDDLRITGRRPRLEGQDVRRNPRRTWLQPPPPTPSAGAPQAGRQSRRGFPPD